MHYKICKQEKNYMSKFNKNTTSRNSCRMFTQKWLKMKMTQYVMFECGISLCVFRVLKYHTYEDALDTLFTKEQKDKEQQ